MERKHTILWQHGIRDHGRLITFAIALHSSHSVRQKRAEQSEKKNKNGDRRSEQFHNLSIICSAAARQVVRKHS